jgi:hypothetical protein
MKTPAAKQWKIAIENELQSLLDSRTWIVVNKTVEVKPLLSRFVFKLKLVSTRNSFDSRKCG